jgi:hypothetical protein
MTVAKVHCGASGSHDRALSVIGLMAYQFLRSNVVSQEADRGRVVIVGHEMTSFGDCQELKVVARAPVSPIDKLCRVGGVRDPVDLSALSPEVRTTVELKSTEPELLRLWAVLSIEFTCVDQYRALGTNQFLNIGRIVE